MHAEGPNQVALVVQHGDGSLVVRCVAFSQPSLTGYDILARSGLDIAAAIGPLGAVVCALDGEGCPTGYCFCQSPPNYWSYWKMRDGAWVYAQMSANSQKVHDGAVEGWAWGPGEPPAILPFDSVCAPQPSPTELISRRIYLPMACRR